MALTNSKAHKAKHSNDIYFIVSASPLKTKLLQDFINRLLLNKKYVVCVLPTSTALERKRFVLVICS